MSADTPRFDISAAGMRAADGDIPAFMEAFAARMEGAFPRRVKIERRRDGLFSRNAHAWKVTVDTGQHCYILIRDRDRLKATRAQTIRGVCLKSEDMAVPQWLAALNADLQALAEQSGSARDILHDFLMS